jgi:hypothetical protein
MEFYYSLYQCIIRKCVSKSSNFATADRDKNSFILSLKIFIRKTINYENSIEKILLNKLQQNCFSKWFIYRTFSNYHSRFGLLPI